MVVFLTTQLQWKPGEIGLVMGISGVVGVLAQLPAGAYIDATTHKRAVVIAACAVIVIASLTMGYAPNFTVITVGQAFIAVAGAIFGPAIAAITLGLVGRKQLDRQVGRNQTFNSTGNILNAVALGLCGYYAARHGIFWFVAAISFVAGLGSWIGKRASESLRKPIFIVAFAILPVRAILYVLTHNPNAFVGIQALEGVGAGIFGIMQLLVVADLTKGTGRFNLAQGTLATSVGIGASISNVVGGYVVRAAGFEAGFATMAGVALAALLFFWRFMPETKIGHETKGSLPAVHPAYSA